MSKLTYHMRTTCNKYRDCLKNTYLKPFLITQFTIHAFIQYNTYFFTRKFLLYCIICIYAKFRLFA